jgi:hypothetical protein
VTPYEGRRAKQRKSLAGEHAEARLRCVYEAWLTPPVPSQQQRLASCRTCSLNACCPA